MLIRIPFNHTIDIDVDRLIQHCDSTQLYELILLANKKLDYLEQTEQSDNNETIKKIDNK